MQDQGKRLLLAVALALGVLLMWQVFFPPPKKPKTPPPAQTPSAQVAPTSVAAGLPQSHVGCTEEMPASPAAKVVRGPEQTIALHFQKFDATFSSRGGVLKAWQLTDPRFKHDVTNKGALMSKGALVPAVPDKGDFEVNFTKGSTIQLPCNAEWTGTKVSDTEIKYSLSTPKVDVVKTFDIDPATFTVKLTVQAKVKTGGDVHQTLVVTGYGYQDPKQAKSASSSRIMPRVWESATLQDGDILSTGVKDLMKWPRYSASFQWTGFDHPYLFVGFAPKPEKGVPLSKHTYADAKVSGLMQTDILYPTQVATHASPSLPTRVVVAYLGPKNFEQLDAADKVAGFPTGFSKVVDLGWFAFIGRPLLWLLLEFHALVGSWGIAIIMLTLLLKGATLYWTTKSMRSMKAMAVLGPQMKELQAKYKQDKQRLQTETMALYKEHGVNPLSGCLPMLIQMPIWWALYRMLESAGELYLQPFIPGWLPDLTGTDPTYVLPIVLVVAMFIQARLNPQSVDPNQKMQQRMMQYGMPIIFGAMSFIFPAGLTLYILTNTILSGFHSVYLNKYDKKSIALAEQLRQAKQGKPVPAPVPDARARQAKDANPKDAAPKAAAEEPSGAAKTTKPATSGKPGQPRQAPGSAKRRKKARRR